MMRHAKRLLAVALLPLLSGPASAQTPAAESTEAASHALDFDLTAGAQLRDLSGSREKFEEYRDVNEGLVLDLQARYHRPESGHFLDLRVANPNRSDESYRIALGRRGRYRLSFSFDAIPHRFSGGTFLWSGFGTGRLQIADVAQAQLQANEQEAIERGGGTISPAVDPNADTSGEDALQQEIVRGLYSAADRVRFGLDRRAVGASLEVNLTPGIRAWARVLNENRDGARVIDAGSYERWFVGGGSTGHTQDRFLVLGAELAEPIDDRTLGVAVGAGMNEERWVADVEYRLTQFRNFNDALLWDNPFRLTHDDTSSGNAFDRSRFAVGQLVLPPNSFAHDVTASGAVDLPMRGRLGASLSYGMITQDEAFQPYTRNEAVIVPTDAAGNVDIPAPFAVLPARDLDGDVRTLAGTLSASVRPLAPLGIGAKYRVYRYDGRSAEITWPGYAGFGESVWRRQRNDPAGPGPFKNEVFDYWRHEADLDVDYRLSRTATVSVMGGWEAWRYDHLRLDRLDELSVGAGFTLRPARNASLKATYRFADRESDGYLRGNTGPNPEARGLLNYNWADRRRHVADARAQYSPSPLVSFGLLGSFMDEEYGGETLGGTAIDRFRFGRTDLTRWLGSADVAVTPAERLSFHASYTIERRKEQLANAAKDNTDKSLDDFFDATGAPIPDNFAPENYWESDITDTIHSLGIGSTFFVLPGRLSVEAGYNLSFSDAEIDTSNPSPGVLTAPDPDLMLLNAVAQDWPTIESRLHEVIVDLAYRWRPNVRTGARYLFASYDLDDFAWEIMNPYMAGVSVENSTRYVFADATYNRYEAHVGTVYVAGTF